MTGGGVIVLKATVGQSCKPAGGEVGLQGATLAAMLAARAEAAPGGGHAR